MILYGDGDHVIIMMNFENYSEHVLCPTMMYILYISICTIARYEKMRESFST
jgi:hypothetical protein